MAYGRSSYEDWERNIREEEGVGEHGYYGIYRDTEGHATTGPGVKIDEDIDDPWRSDSFGGIGAQAPKDWVDAQASKRMGEAWDNATQYRSSRKIPDDPRSANALASMFYQLGANWPEEHIDTDRFLSEGRYEDASNEVWNSDWARQTPERTKIASDAFSALAGIEPISTDDYADGGIDYSDIGREIEENRRRRQQEKAPEEVKYRMLSLPDGSQVKVHPDVSDEDALTRAKAIRPESFEVAEERVDYGEKDSNFLEAFGAGTTRSSLGLWPGTKAFIATLTGNEEAYDESQAELAEISEMARGIAPDLVTTEEIGKVYEEDGLISAIAKSFEFGTEQIFQSFGFQAPALAVGGLAALAAGAGLLPAAVTVGGAGMVAGAAMMFVNYLSENLERGYEEGNIDTKDVEVFKLLAASGGQAALDSLSYMLAGGTALLSAGGKKAFWASTSKFLNELEKLSPVKRMLATIAEEEVAEVGQQALERMSAGLSVSPFEEDAAKEYIQIMLATLAPSMGFAGMGSASSAWTKAKARRAEDGTQKVGGERVETFRALDSMAKDEIGRRVEDQAVQVETERADLAGRTREEGVASAKDVHNVARDRNIRFDNDAGFMSFTKRLVGEYHIDDMTPEQRQVVYDRISSMPVQDIETSLQIAPDDKAITLAKSAVFKGGRRGRAVTLAAVKEALNLDEKISKDTGDALAQGYLDKMIRLGLTRESRGKTVIARVGAGVNPDKYQKIIDRVREKGSFPTRKEMEEEFQVRNEDVYDSILSKALGQNEVEAGPRGTYLAKPLGVGQSGGFRIEVDGVAQDGFYETEADAEAAADSKYQEDNKSWEVQRRLNERLRAPESMRPDRRVRDVRIVEESGVRGSDVVSNFGYSVESASGTRSKDNRGGRWVVRDLAGKVVKHFRTAAEAKAFKKRRDQNAYHYEVSVDGVEISRHKTEREANRALKKWKDDQAASVEDKIIEDFGTVPNIQSALSRTRHTTAEISRVLDDAVEQGKAFARNSARRRKLKKIKVPEDSNLNEPSREDGFVVLEDRIGEDGKRSAAPVGFYETEQEANRASSDLQKKRVGRESFGGRIARKGSAKASEDMRAKRADPEAWAASQIPLPPAPEGQAEWIAKLQTRLEEVLRGRGLQMFRINLVDALELGDDTNALFVSATNTLKLALGVDLEGMTIDEQVSALSPYLRHEILHGLRRLALIKPGEWTHLMKWVDKTRISQSRLDLLNDGRSDPFPPTTTYLDYAKAVYGEEGTRAIEKADLLRRKENGEITDDKYKEDLSEIESTEWILDDYYEEAVAAAIEDWPSIAPGDPKPGMVRAILRRIAKGIKIIGNAMNGLGFTTQRDVIELVYGGQFNERVARSKSFDLWYSRRPAMKEALFESQIVAEKELARLNREKKKRDAITRALKAGDTPEAAEAAAEAAAQAEEGSEFDVGILDGEATAADRRSRRLRRIVQDDGESPDQTWEPIPEDTNSKFLNGAKDQVPTKKEMRDGLKSNQVSKLGKNRELKEGKTVRVRIDIDFFKKWSKLGIPKYVQTVHDTVDANGNRVSPESQKVGSPIGYDSSVRLKGPISFRGSEAGAEKIKTGDQNKFPLAVVEGAITQDRSRPRNINNWTPVGYNPRKAPFFYDKKTGQEILGGIDAYSIGNTVFVRSVGKENIGPRNAKTAYDYLETGNRRALKPTGKTPKSSSSEHLMNIQRGKKVTGKARWTNGERQRIREQAKKHGLTIKSIEKYVRARKQAHPAKAGWTPWIYNLTKIVKGKPVHEPVTTPYTFDRDKDGNILRGKDRARSVQSLARKIKDEVREVYARSNAGDKTADTILRQSNWYREMRRRIRKEFGGFGDLFADLLGATSPNTPVSLNWQSAVEALRLASKGHYDEMILGWESWLEKVESSELSLLSWVENKLADGVSEIDSINSEYESKVSRLDNQTRTQIKKSEEGSRRWSEVLKINKKDHPVERAEAESRYYAWSDSLFVKGKKERRILNDQRREQIRGVENSSVSRVTSSHEFKRRKDELTKLRKLPDHLVPKKENGRKFNINSDLVAKVMVHMWRVIKEENAVQGATAPKALTFSGNLIGFRDKATIDVWAARLLQRLKHGNRVPSQAEGAVEGKMLPSGETTGAFRFGQDVFNRAVEMIRDDPVLSRDSKLSEINDDDLQAVVWFIEKELWAKDDTTSAEGEGGSFEFWANLEGSSNRDRIKELNRILVGKPYSSDEKAAAAQELDALQRLVDRYLGGLSIERDSDIKDQLYQEWLPWAMSAISERAKSSIYEGDPNATILASKIATTEGRYGRTGETAFDWEFVAREGFDAGVLFRKIVEIGNESDQESVFLSRVLRDDESIDPLIHRPGIEIYFSEPVEMDATSGIREAFDSVLGGGYTIIVDSRQDSGTLGGEMPRVVGVRAQYIPEYGDAEAIEGMSNEEIRNHMMEKRKEIVDSLSAPVVPASVVGNLPDISSANVLWYETDVVFRHEYNEVLEESVDGYGGRGQGDDVGPIEEGAWRGRTVREGARSANRQRQIGEGLEVESIPSRDASDRRSARATGGERGGIVEALNDAIELRNARRPGRSTFDRGRAEREFDRSRERDARDRRYASSIVRAQRAAIDLPSDLYEAIPNPRDKARDNYVWGWFNYHTDGQKPKGGHKTRAVVTKGYHQDSGTVNGVRVNRTGIGARHAEFHDRDIQNNTPYNNWKELISDFFVVLENSPKNLGSGYIYPDVNGSYASFLWDDPRFRHPVTIIFSGEDHVAGDTPVFMFVTAYPSEKYDTYQNSPDQSKGIVPTHGPSVDAKTMKTYLRPAVARQFQEKSKINRSDRRSLNPSSSTKPADVTRAADNLWGKSRHDGRTFWNHIESGWKYFTSEEWRESLRTKYLDKYRAIYRQGKRVGTRGLDAAVASLADTSAHAAALMSDRAAGFLSAAFKYGVIRYRDGIPVVEDLELRNTVMGTYYDEATNSLVRREVTVNVYDDGETGGLIPILNPASSPEKNLVEELFLYSSALRAFRLREKGISPPMSIADMLVGLKLVERYPELAVIHANMQRWNNGTVEFLISTGVIGRKMGNVWMESVDYLPFYLNLENETTDMQQQIIEATLGEKADFMMINSLVGAKPSRKILGMGADQKIMEPIEAISKNTMAAITAGLNNVAVQRSVRDAWYLEQAAKVESGEGEDVITVRIKGEEVHFKLADPLLHHALVGTLEGANPLIEFLGGPARFLREVVTRSPEFMVANMLRDSLSVWTVNGGRFPPVVKTFHQFGKNLKQQWKVKSVNPEYMQLEKHGVIGGYDLGATTPKRLERFFARKVTGKKTGLSPIRAVWDLLGETSALSESSTRELVYNQVYDRVFSDLRETGMGIELASRRAQGEAAFQAMEILNFSRRGNSPWLKFVTATVPFLNARLQGIDVMVRTMKGEHAQLPGISNRNRILTSILGRASLLSMMTMAYALMMHDDEEYKNLRPEVKDDYWHLPIIPGGGFLSIPIPFEAGVLFKVLPQTFVELMMGGTSRDALNSMKHAAISTLNFNPIPQAVKPILEVMMNKNIFTGRPIVPFYMEHMEDAYQTRASTTTIANMLGGETAQMLTLGAAPSPLQWENLLRGYVGGMGMMTATIFDAVARTVTPGLPGTPWPRATDMIFAGRFYQDEFGGGLKAGYYELRNEINGIVTTVNSMAKTDPGKAARYAREHSSVLRLKSTVRELDKRMKLIRDKRTRVFLSTSMDMFEKRRILDSLDRTENTILKIVPKLRRSAYMNIEY